MWTIHNRAGAGLRLPHKVIWGEGCNNVLANWSVDVDPPARVKTSRCGPDEREVGRWNAWWQNTCWSNWKRTPEHNLDSTIKNNRMTKQTNWDLNNMHLCWSSKIDVFLEADHPNSNAAENYLTDFVAGSGKSWNGIRSAKNAVHVSSYLIIQQ